MSGSASLVNGRTPAHDRANRAPRSSGRAAEHALGDEGDAGENRLPIETGVVHRDPEQVRPVGGLAGRLEERQSVSPLGLRLERRRVEAGELLEDGVLLHGRRAVQDVLEPRRHRLGLHDLQPHRMDG